MTHPDLQRRLDRALADPGLEENVRRATDASTAHRAEVVAERPDWGVLRERAARLRDHVLTNLADHLEAFTDAARARGAIVHVAANAAAARDTVLRILRAAGARHVLKSKSMVTEEIELNPALEAAGMTPLETDLGEYIVQLAGEPPSHITAPALHRRAEQILDLFRREGVLAGRGDPPADRRELATWLSLAAREHLRERLRVADAGITGANFLVAETGSVVLVENEGNIRYTTTSSSLQIVVAGIERVLPRLEDLATLLPLLTRSATGQRMTTYATLLSGGYASLHVVLLDGGRSRLLEDPDDREILRCIRCGACMNVCPVYRTVGGHAYGSPYPGPIGALFTPLVRGRPDDDELPWASSLCGACTEVCPVGIDLHGHLLRLRARAVARGRRGIRERWAIRLWAFLVAGPRRYHAATWIARRLQPLARRLGLPRTWTRTREPPRLAPRPFRTLWREDDGMDRPTPPRDA